jgi:hypothetical protein
MKLLLNPFRIGKTTLVSLTALILIVVLVLVWVMAILVSPLKATGEKYPAKTFILPYNRESYKTIVLIDLDTGNPINGSTGDSASNTTWDSAEIAGSNHAITNAWVFSIPATNVDNIYIMRYDVAPASIDKTTSTAYSPILFNPKTARTFTDSNPIANNQVDIPIKTSR